VLILPLRSDDSWSLGHYYRQKISSYQQICGFTSSQQCPFPCCCRKRGLSASNLHPANHIGPIAAHPPSQSCHARNEPCCQSIPSQPRTRFWQRFSGRCQAPADFGTEAEKVELVSAVAIARHIWALADLEPNIKSFRGGRSLP